VRTRKSMGIIYGMSLLHIEYASFANAPDDTMDQPYSPRSSNAHLTHQYQYTHSFHSSVRNSAGKDRTNSLAKTGKRQRRAQTLYRGIHITRIPQILQPRRVAPIRRRVVARDPRRAPTAPTSTNTNPGPARDVPLGRSCRSSADDATAGDGRRMCCADG
jgi:hypothetical protein